MIQNNAIMIIPSMKKGSGIHIKKSHAGLFTKYCKGKVTNECIQRGKNSPDPKIRKRATFAANARKWKHQSGGMINFNYPNQALPSLPKFNTNLKENLETLENEKQQKIIDMQNQLTQKELDRANKIENVQNIINSFDTNNLIDAWSSMKLNKQLKKDMKKNDAPINNSTISDSIKASIMEPWANNPSSWRNKIAEQYNFMKNKGGKFHKPFGHISILDDTGIVDPKTLKLKKSWQLKRN